MDVTDTVRASAKNIYTILLVFGPPTALHPQAHIHQYALVDAPCLILIKTGEPKYGEILHIYFFSETFKRAYRAVL